MSAWVQLIADMDIPDGPDGGMNLQSRRSQFTDRELYRELKEINPGPRDYHWQGGQESLIEEAYSRASYDMDYKSGKIDAYTAAERALQDIYDETPEEYK